MVSWDILACLEMPNARFISMDKHTVHCIFGVMYMHFWYAMHRQLWWCLVGVITIVQCIFGVETFSRVHAFTWCGRLAPLLRSLTTEASQLRIYVSTFNLRFNHLNGDHLGAVEVNNQKPLLLLQQLPATAALHKVSALNFISP